MPVILIQSPCISQTGVAARPGAGRPYERNKYPQTTPLNRRENFFFTFFKKRLGKVLEYAALHIIVKDFADDGVHLLQAALEYLFIEVFLVFVHNYRSSMQSYEKRGRGKRKPPIWWDRG